MTKKYTLKPGRHQFAPGSYAIHSNDNLSDDEAAWYLERYPHIAAMFITGPGNGQSQLTIAESEACRVSEVEIPEISISASATATIEPVKSQEILNNEDLSTTN